MARQKLSQEEKEILKQQKQEEKDLLISSCILREEDGFSKSEITKFLKMCENLEVEQTELLHLAVSALLNEKILFKTNKKITLSLLD